MKHISQIIIRFIKLYQSHISPLKRRTCRFHPTCSNYAIDAISIYGPVGGSIRAFKRIIKCHPFNPGGYDPVVKKQSTVHRPQSIV